MAVIETHGSAPPKLGAYDLYRYWVGVVPAKTSPPARLLQQLKLFVVCHRAAQGNAAVDLDDIF